MKIINVVYLCFVIACLKFEENAENVQTDVTSTEKATIDKDIPTKYEQELEEQMKNMNPEQQQKFMDELNDKLQSLSNMGCISFVQNQLQKYTYDIKKIQKKSNGPDKIKKMVGQLYNICKNLDQEQQFKFMIPDPSGQNQMNDIEALKKFDANSILEAEEVNIEKEELDGYNNFEKYAKEIEELKKQADKGQTTQKTTPKNFRSKENTKEDKNQQQQKNRGSSGSTVMGQNKKTLHPIIKFIIVLLCFIVPGMYIWNQLFNKKEEEAKKKKNKKKKVD